MVSGIFLLIAMAWWIRNDKQYLDESTKWLYADEKGVQVFALYGIGDSTEATPLYAVGGEKALKAHEFLTSKMEVLDNEAERNRENVGRWISGVRGDEKYDRYDTHALGRTGTVTNGTDQLHGGTPNGDSERIAGKGNRNGEVKFSLRDYGLTEDEEHAIVSYKSGDSYALNGKLATGGELTELQRALRDHLDTALEKLPVYKGTVYRHYDFDSFGGYDAMAEFLSMFEKGKPTPMKSYLSASTVRNEDRTNGEYTIDMVIQSETGRSLNGFGRNTENEVLLPRTVRLAVDSMELVGPHKIRMIAREVVENGEGTTADARSDGMRDVRESALWRSGLRPVSERNSEEVLGQGRRDSGRDRDAGLSGLREGEGSGSMGGSGVESDYRAAEEGLKYQPREQSVSDRQILANALERVAQNERERSILADYREKAAKMAFYERELAKREQKIADHRSGKAVLEPDKIRRAEVSAQKYAALISQQEWNLLNRRMTEEIESSEQYLDEATKWLYADEKGVQVFALYGIGDGTEATPLYAVGRKQAAAYNAAMTKYLEGKEHADESAVDFDGWIKSHRSAGMDQSRSVLHGGQRGSNGHADGGVYRGSSERTGGSVSERSSKDQPGVKEKFSLRDSAGRELTAAQQVLSTH